MLHKYNTTNILIRKTFLPTLSCTKILLNQLNFFKTSYAKFVHNNLVSPNSN